MTVCLKSSDKMSLEVLVARLASQPNQINARTRALKMPLRKFCLLPALSIQAEAGFHKKHKSTRGPPALSPSFRSSSSTNLPFAPRQSAPCTFRETSSHQKQPNAPRCTTVYIDLFPATGTPLINRNGQQSIRLRRAFRFRLIHHLSAGK